VHRPRVRTQIFCGGRCWVLNLWVQCSENPGCAMCERKHTDTRINVAINNTCCTITACADKIKNIMLSAFVEILPPHIPRLVDDYCHVPDALLSPDISGGPHVSLFGYLSNPVLIVAEIRVMQLLRISCAHEHHWFHCSPSCCSRKVR